jgi:hypothetical protein
MSKRNENKEKKRLKTIRDNWKLLIKFVSSSVVCLSRFFFPTFDPPSLGMLSSSSALLQYDF